MLTVILLFLVERDEVRGHVDICRRSASRREKERARTLVREVEAEAVLGEMANAVVVEVDVREAVI